MCLIRIVLIILLTSMVGISQADRLVDPLDTITANQPLVIRIPGVNLQNNAPLNITTAAVIRKPRYGSVRFDRMRRFVYIPNTRGQIGDVFIYKVLDKYHHIVWIKVYIHPNGDVHQVQLLSTVDKYSFQ